MIHTPHGVPLAIENAYREADEPHDHDHYHHHHHHSSNPDHLPENMLNPVAVVTFS